MVWLFSKDDKKNVEELSSSEYVDLVDLFG